MTSRQRQILVFVVGYRAAKGYAPSTREIGDWLGISSPNGVRTHLLALRRQGLIVWEPRVARTLRLTRQGKAALRGDYTAQ